MIYKLVTSRPTQAIVTSDNSKRGDGDGRGTAGTSPAGVGAVGANGSQPCEIPPQHQSPGAVAEPIMSRRSQTSRSASSRAAQSLGLTGNLGNVPPSPGGVAARRTPDPINELHPAAPVKAPGILLKKRSVRISTWNMRGRSGPSNSPKIDTAKMIMRLEKVDLLVLTETHSTSELPPSSRGLNVLSHTGSTSTRAGVAICAIDNGRWSCTSSVVLVPGHAIICELYNSVSTESLHLLGVYANISDYAACTTFYTDLYNSLSDYIHSFNERPRSPTWRGCLAAGDWNFVESDIDRFPFKNPSYDTKRCRSIFAKIKSLCLMTNTAGSAGSFRKHTFSQNARGVSVLSRLDRIYHPLDGWTASAPLAFKTNHSDHHFVWSDCFVTSPRVELAKPAPRLPPLQFLEVGPFWPAVLSAWSDLSSGPIDLPHWTLFKKSILSHSLAIAQTCRSCIDKSWKSALRGDEVPEHELDDIVFCWNDSQRLLPPPGTGRHPWRSAVCAYDAPPSTHHCPCKLSLYPVALSPPPSPVIHSYAATAAPPDPSIRSAPILPAVPDLLDWRITAKRASQLHKYREMERLHTSAWYNLSSNKEADERGSRASISVEGLHRRIAKNATTDLKRMLHIAQQHFAALHTPPAMTTLCSRSQLALLQEISSEYGPNPGPSSSPKGDFSVAEIVALKPRMPNTAPGLDGLPYGFYKALASKLDFLISSGQQAASFWDVFRSLTNEICANGSNRCDFKLANLSLFYKKGDPTLVSNYQPISSMNRL